jgi:hypothetical protein
VKTAASGIHAKLNDDVAHAPTTDKKARKV